MKYVNGFLLIVVAIGIIKIGFFNNNRLPVQNINQETQTQNSSGRNIQNSSSRNVQSNSLEDIGLDYYLEKYELSEDTEGIESKLQNFGCHQEIHIFRDGELVMRMVYFNNQIYEL